MRTQVKTVNSEALSITEAMRAVTPLQVGAIRKRMRDALEKRAQVDVEAVKSKDWKSLQKLADSEAVARLWTVQEIDPVAYICNGQLSDEELTKRGFDPEARTVNLKAYKKVVECAEYLLDGKSHLEAVFKTVVACLIVSTRHTEVAPRDFCENFLSRIRLDTVSADLADALDSFKAKHMTGGAQTQTTQCLLTLANLKAGRMVRNGRSKDFALNPSSGIVIALAERFGMTEALQSIPNRIADAVEVEAE